MKLNKKKLQEKAKQSNQPSNDIFDLNNGTSTPQTEEESNFFDDYNDKEDLNTSDSFGDFEVIHVEEEMELPTQSQPQQQQNQRQGSFLNSQSNQEDELEDDFNFTAVPDPIQQAKPKDSKKPRKPKREQTEKLDINIDMSSVSGNIEGSDFDTQGNLKKKKKKTKKAPFGGIAVILLLGIIGIGAYAFINSKQQNTEPPEDLTSENPINNPAEDNGQYVPPVLEDPPAYLDDVDEEDVVETKVDPSTLTPEEQKQLELEKIYQDYLTHDNTYTNFQVKYPNTWYITEKVQDSFNEIKALSKEGVFSFKTASLQKKMNLLEFKSPDAENTTYVDILALPKTGFNKAQLHVNFELPDQLIVIQPMQFQSESWGTHNLEVGYTLQQEFNLTYLVVQAYETVNNNIIMYTFKEPFFDTAELVASEEETEEGTENTNTPLDNKLTIDQIKELTPSLKIYKNIVTSIEIH